MNTHKVMAGLTPLELNSIMNLIKLKHCLTKGRCVKYVDTSFDFRTLTFWRILIRPFGGRKEFSVCNRFDNPKQDTLYDEILDWLKEVEK